MSEEAAPLSHATRGSRARLHAWTRLVYVAIALIELVAKLPRLRVAPRKTQPKHLGAGLLAGAEADGSALLLTTQSSQIAISLAQALWRSPSSQKVVNDVPDHTAPPRNRRTHERQICATPTATNDRDLLQAEVTQLDANRQRMDCQRYRDQRLPIGSGTVESACKNVVGRPHEGQRHALDAPRGAAHATDSSVPDEQALGMRRPTLASRTDRVLGHAGCCLSRPSTV